MPSDSNLNNIPPSPIDDDDLWLINREDKSYKVTSKMLGGYLIGSPIPEICENDGDCPPDRLCVDGYCERIPCDSEKPPGQEGCPPDYVCIGDYCYPKCDILVGCGDGYVCVDPGITGGDSICLPYPFPCRPDLLPGDGCPPGYACWGGNCWQTCSGPGTCPPGMDCVETPTNEGVGYICVPTGGGFPCADGVCPIGYECFFGMCFQACNIDGSGKPCEEGFVCVGTDLGDYCIPYPFPCDLYGPGCPDGMVCYNGECFPTCDLSDPNSCEEGFSCLEIGNGITICYPEFPQEGFVNDGPLVIRTEPLDYPDSPASESIVFTANQYGRSVLTFQGFAQNPGGPGGGDCSQGQVCPTGYECVGGICVLTPCNDGSDCPDGTVCFAGHCYEVCNPEENRPCKPGFECTEVIPGLNLCLPGGETGGGKCEDGVCPPGYECVDISGEKYCVPVSCANGACPDGLECFNDFCYKPCGGYGSGRCDENFVCVEIPALDDSVCMPIGGGGSGGGSGGDINIIVDPGWWNPDENDQSPIGNGILILKDKEGNIAPLFTANQFANSIFTTNDLDIIPPGSGTPCTDDQDCPPGEFCGDNGKCVTGSGDQCTLSSDCPEGEVCIDGRCYGNGTDGIDGEISIEVDFSQVMPAGSRLIFPQASAPDHWVKLTGYNQHALRIVDGSGGGTGGILDFTAAFKNHNVPLLKHKHSVSSSGSTNETGAHTHNFTVKLNKAASITTDGANYTPEREIDLELGEFLEDAYNLLVDNEFLGREVYDKLLLEALDARSTEGFVTVIQAFVDLQEGTINQSAFDTIVSDEMIRLEKIDYKNLGFGLEDSDCQDITCPNNMNCVNGMCICEVGHVYDVNTESCIPDPQASYGVDTCPENAEFDGMNCECIDGYALNTSGVCVEVPGGYPEPLCQPAYCCVRVRDNNWPVKSCGGRRTVYMSTSCTGNEGSTTSGTFAEQNGVKIDLYNTTGVTWTGDKRNFSINVGQFPFDVRNGNIKFTLTHPYLGSRSHSVGSGTNTPIYQCDPCVGVNCGANATCSNGKCICSNGFVMIDGKCQPEVVTGTSDPAGTHKHTVSTTGSTNEQGVSPAQMDLRVKYLNSIVCEKEPYN